MYKAYYNNYMQLFNDSGAMEWIMPRKVTSYEELIRMGYVIQDTHEFLENNDKEVEIEAFNRSIADPIYELVDIEPNKHGAAFGFILANEFGIDVSDYRKNKLFYYLMAA
mmetsp:Transcript_21858/g.25138  ORF Transcript_21858/g.25138 Transcript_21858/m.25138 type:complete len:110 (+) Transcript_21858:2-331(+)